MERWEGWEGKVLSFLFVCVCGCGGSCRGCALTGYLSWSVCWSVRSYRNLCMCVDVYVYVSVSVSPCVCVFF